MGRSKRRLKFKADFEVIAPGAFGDSPKTVPVKDVNGEVIGTAVVKPDGMAVMEIDGSTAEVLGLVQPASMLSIFHDGDLARATDATMLNGLMSQSTAENPWPPR